MSSSFKTTGVPIILVVAMVFGVTYMSQFLTTAKPKDVADEDTLDSGPPLNVGTTQRMFNPSDSLAANRFFPGLFELGTDGAANRVGFFIRNAKSQTIRLAALTPSCTKCTSASAAVIPPDSMAQYLAATAVGSLWGAIPTPLTPIAWANVRNTLQWHDFEFNNPTKAFDMPPAPAATVEQWGLLELGYKIGAAGPPNPTHAFFDVYDSRGQKIQSQPYTFTVVFSGREPMEVSATDLNFGDLTEGTPPKAVELLCVSATRRQLPPPAVSIVDNDPFVTVSPPTPLTEDELAAASYAMTVRLDFPIRILSGYRYVVAVSREANGRSMDVGRFSKEINIAGGPGIVLQKPYRVVLTGSVVGFLRLETGTGIEFGTYQGDYAQKKETRLWTDRPGVELELVADQCQPSFVTPTLSPPTLEAGRTIWTITTRIADKEGKQPPWNGKIVLRTKGPTPTTFVFPMSGHGR